jgi:hypothetical protein
MQSRNGPAVLRWVRPVIVQAHPGTYKGAPWLGRGPAHRQGTGAPPRRTWSSAGCALDQPWDSAGAPERRGLREGAPWLGQGSHCQPTPRTGAVQLRPQGALLAPSSTRSYSSAKLKCACKAVDIYSFASVSGLQSRHGLHRQLLQHAATKASMCTAAYAQLVDEASTGERRASTGCVLCRGIHWRC